MMSVKSMEITSLALGSLILGCGYAIYGSIIWNTRVLLLHSNFKCFSHRQVRFFGKMGNPVFDLLWPNGAPWHLLQNANGYPHSYE
jgi:hypothetical protein